MASNIPTRRVTRTTRTTVLKDENANARTRPILRTKPASNGPSLAVPAPTRATSATASTRAKSVATNVKAEAPADVDPGVQKRKRAAFGEVVGYQNRDKHKSGAPGAGKGKAKDDAATSTAPAPSKFVGVVISKTTRTITAPAAAVPRQPLKTTTARSSKHITRPSSAADHAPLEELKEEEPEENAMAIDLPARRVGARTSTSAALASAADVRRRTSARSVKAPGPEEDDAEASRVFKKRRTSSEAPEEYDVPHEHADVHAEPIDKLVSHGKVVKAEKEADPNVGWDDLDREDVDDPLMVSEYVVEIFEYLKIVEQKTLPNPNYMDNQKDLAWKMRGILTDWLIQVHMRFRLLPETLFLAVNIIDRFLSARVVSLAKLQLVGITCMFVAAKVEEIVAPSASNFLYCADSSYTEAEILQAEKYILKTLEWNMNYPNPIHFLRRVSKADEYNVQVRTVAKYLMEIECVEWRLIGAPPSLIAASSVWLARLILGRDEWHANLAHYSSYAESALIPTANLMLNYVLKPVRHPSFFKKYASKKYLKASAFVREWALQRWEENTVVDLEVELPALKALVRAARERAIAEGIDPDAMSGPNLELGP
ncbi:hypothetical protein EWM64_g4472 [Hericium alpestre]|uniref:Uncharacterized protein n=1 Tax=Hericium alpestre TaxID=135208 RepID=A0A4Y9ZZF7_9AGAM|nr:hypothetical protein EWM64_g4472 [Hericium alpestre]